jgi:hypothetical protein
MGPRGFLLGVWSGGAFSKDFGLTPFGLWVALARTVLFAGFFRPVIFRLLLRAGACLQNAVSPQ